VEHCAAAATDDGALPVAESSQDVAALLVHSTRSSILLYGSQDLDRLCMINKNQPPESLRI